MNLIRCTNSIQDEKIYDEEESNKETNKKANVANIMDDYLNEKQKRINLIRKGSKLIQIQRTSRLLQKQKADQQNVAQEIYNSFQSFKSSVNEASNHKISFGQKESDKQELSTKQTEHTLVHNYTRDLRTA